MNCLCMETCNRPQKMGLDDGGGGAGAPLVRPHQGWPRWPPPCSGGLLAGPRLHPRWYSAQVSCVGGLLSPSLVWNLLYAFVFAHFGMFSTCIQTCDLQNMFCQIQLELDQ